jgi:hypothetical protein
MSKLETFIGGDFRPDIHGGKLDKSHKTKFLFNEKDLSSDIKIELCNAICFGPKKDNVLLTIEHAIVREDNIFVFYYEDIHARWSYSCSNGDSFFIYKKNEEEFYKIRPKYLYIRGCYIDEKDTYWWILGLFFNFIDIWDGKILCPPKSQLSNESKLFQLNNSLKKSSENPISIGNSYVIKGRKHLKFLDSKKSHIVKSLSGIRSIVVDDDTYKNWNYNSINNIPVLFQEKAIGNDLRVHVLNKKTYSKISSAKDNVDYRYDKNFYNLLDVESLDARLIDFCIAVSKEEENNMLGIDFIKTKHGYVVLEANPSPGWSAYYPYDGISLNSFICDLFSVLKNG